MTEGASRQPARRTGAVLSGGGVEREVPVCAASERSGVAAVVRGAEWAIGLSTESCLRTFAGLIN